MEIQVEDIRVYSAGQNKQIDEFIKTFTQILDASEKFVEMAIEESKYLEMIAIGLSTERIGSIFWRKIENYLLSNGLIDDRKVKLTLRNNRTEIWVVTEYK